LVVLNVVLDMWFWLADANPKFVMFRHVGVGAAEAGQAEPGTDVPAKAGHPDAEHHRRLTRCLAFY
jgi:hypothetical protein